MPAASTQRFDSGSLRTVADEQQHGSRRPRRRSNELLDDVEAAEAAGPTDHDLAVEAEAGADLSSVRRRGEAIEVDARRGNQHALGFAHRGEHLLRDGLGTARDDGGCP